MRIQHNIMAMNAYRNYTSNVNAMKKNLEKLSSGYKINRAGDDAAGLAISEKMRAQITGLQQAQANAKSGINLVQTAEGALTEVHDMLNRMVKLADQSANGTYDDSVDRVQLQKELNQLTTEINRIADSSNFNGIKLLDGSMSSDAAKISGDARIINEVYTTGNAAELSGTRTFLDGEVPTQEVKTVFDVDFTGLSAKQGSTTGSFTAGTPTKNSTAITAAVVGLDFGTATSVGAGNADKIKAATLNLGDGLTIKFDALNITDATTMADAKTAIEAAIKTQVDAYNAKGEAGTTDYNKKEVGTMVWANGQFGFGVNAVTTTPQTYEEDTDMEFTFKIGNTEFDATLEDFDKDDTTTYDAAAIAKAAFVALGGDKANLTTAVPVKVNGINYDVTCAGSKLTFTLKDDATDKNVAANYDWDVIGNKGDYFDGNHTAGVKVTTPGTAYKDAPLANTVFKIESADIKDGTQITIDGKTVTLAVGKNSKFTNAGGKVDLTWMEEGSVDLDKAISAISKGFAGDTDNFIVGVNDTSNGDTHPGLTVHKKATSTEKYTTKAKLASVFELTKPAGGGLTLQIGDTSETFNQLNVSIKDMHAASLGISGIDISTQEGAAAAVTAIKDAINMVSDVRGTLGATQNRLDHTINNLSVMTENIQDAESTIRDTDVADEMMAYTKNNILIQSAQAMLAQANQVPQGVLQLLQ